MADQYDDDNGELGMQGLKDRARMAFYWSRHYCIGGVAMKYVKCYDGAWDIVYQCEVSDEAAAKIRHHEISDGPIPGLSILPANRSEWDLDLVRKLSAA